jgi:hypothetical protein
MDGAVAAGRCYRGEPALGGFEGQLLGMAGPLGRKKLYVRSQQASQLFELGARSAAGRDRIENDAGGHVYPRPEKEEHEKTKGENAKETRIVYVFSFSIYRFSSFRVPLDGPHEPGGRWARLLG